MAVQWRFFVFNEGPVNKRYFIWLIELKADTMQPLSKISARCADTGTVIAALHEVGTKIIDPENKGYCLEFF